jgi:uncharacterized membrane protein
MLWFLIVDVFLLAGVVIIVGKRGLNISFLVSALVIAAWYFYGSIGVYDALGLVSIPLLLFCMVYLVCVFMQWAIGRIFAKKEKIEDDTQRTKEEKEIVRRYRRAGEDDRRVIDLILAKYEHENKKSKKSDK